MARDDSSDSDSEGASKEAWPLWKLVLIALPQLGVQVLWCFIGPNSAPYMLHLGMKPWLATLNNVAGPITGFFTGPLVGATSDNCTCSWGRRRPVILAGLISTWVAGMLFAGAEHIFAEKSSALYFAAPMYWVMDVTINILQTPHRALVADLASEEQQVPMQVVFVFMMAIGNFLAFSIMRIYTVPVDHMLALMVGICGLNTLCIAIQFSVAKEKQFKYTGEAAESACAPIVNVVNAVKQAPCVLWHLAGIQCLVWIGNTAWNLYAGQWFTNSVFEGDAKAPEGSPGKIAYGDGNYAFTVGGQLKSVLQLLSALLIIFLLLKNIVRPRNVYAPCIFIGGIVSILAAFFVGNNSAFAIACITFSIMPETGSFAIPFGLVATLNKRAEKEGKVVSTALQMSLLNCCVTVGQQICTTALAIIETGVSLKEGLPRVFVLAAVAQTIAGCFTLCLNDKPPEEDGDEPLVSE